MPSADWELVTNISDQTRVQILQNLANDAPFFLVNLLRLAKKAKVFTWSAIGSDSPSTSRMESGIPTSWAEVITSVKFCNVNNAQI